MMATHTPPSELIQAYVDAFNRHDLERQLAVLHPDVEHEINEGPTEIGIAAFRRFKEKMNVHYREQLRDVRVYGDADSGACEFICEGEYLVCDDGLPAAHGQRYSIRAAFFVSAAEGKISRMTSYYNLKNWIDAVSA
jgi:hypothetical protein